MYIEKVLDLGVQLMKNGGKNKSVALIILFSIFITSSSAISQSKNGFIMIDWTTLSFR